VPPEDRPPAGIVHVAFQIMVACGVVMMIVGAWSIWRARRRLRGIGTPVADDRPYLRALAFTAPLGFVAVEAGWTVTEVGRQPWIIQGVMRTSEAVTPMPGLVVPFLGFTLLYLGLSVAVVWLLYRQILKTGVDNAWRPGITQELPLPARP
jgi:cytochrome bd ubiquinol oxidase subunit I